MKIIIKKEPKVALFENSIVNIYYWEEIDLPKEEIKQMLKDIILVKRKIDFFSDYILEYVNMVFLRDITLEEIFGDEFEETFKKLIEEREKKLKMLEYAYNSNDKERYKDFINHHEWKMGLLKKGKKRENGLVLKWEDREKEELRYKRIMKEYGQLLCTAMHPSDCVEYLRKKYNIIDKQE